MISNKYIVFDLDWTLADTQIIHQQIESDFLRSFWINIKPEDIWKKYAWRSPQEWIPELLTENEVNFTQKDIDDFVDWKDEKVIKLLQDWNIELMDWTEEVLRNLYSKWYRLWISSGACREFIDNFIDYFNFNEIIDASTSANEVKNKKPHPDVFQKSFEQLEKKYWKSIEKIVVWDWWSDVMWWKWCDSITIWINENSPKDKKVLDFQVKNIKKIYDIIVKK